LINSEKKNLSSFLFCFFKAYYENLQDKLNQLKDAREALNALRTEHHERKQREALERDRQRQMQLAQKLDFMRQKKQVRFFYFSFF
jgi:growth factor-regulated tyrosine kinase substrate